MKIIVLQGKRNSGKTTTIWYVRDLIINNNGNSKELIVFGKQSHYEDDFSDVIDFNNLKIGMFSMGDLSNNLSQAIYKFANKGCDVVICALSLSGSKIRANQAINTYIATRVDKTIEHNKDLRTQVNRMDAQTIFNLI
ncbi:MAG: hypothetical protein CVU02_02380 [Bacteroidetes bacterium HGW-Bacteroidetes-19]|nr:MAG: hypothetical protein CVU02_02380 [Bacteroidetes bacterium HGW-Bacteroidetes-19]